VKLLVIPYDLRDEDLYDYIRDHLVKIGVLTA
jgi:hypothetical protein